MSSPAQMFDHELNGVKAFEPGKPWVTDKAIDLDDSVDAADVKAGMVVSQDPTSAKWVLGVGSLSAISRPMPFLIFQNGDDFDVVGDDGNIIGAGADGVMLPRIMGVAVNMGAEVESTEFEDDDYAPGDLLTGNSDGKLEIVGNSGADTILGVVSDGVIQSEHGDRSGDNIKQLLRFHTVYALRFA